MFEIEKTYRFEAAHQLVNHDGKCRDMHGHSYILDVLLRSETLIETGPKTNMVLDFGDIDLVVKSLIQSHLDHKFLNNTLNTDSPTAEAIAKWIFEKLESKLPQLVRITVHETASSRASYFKV